VSVILESGQSAAGDLFVIAAGPWTSTLVPELKSFYGSEGQVETIVVKPGVSDKIAGKWPIVFFDTFLKEDAGIYMEPHRKTARNDGAALKIGCHYRGLAISHEDITNELKVAANRLESTNAEVPKQIATLVENIPQLQGAQPVYSKHCFYDEAYDGSFLLDFHPAHRNLFVAVGGSGHGFKFFPVLGDLVVRRMEGRTAPYNAGDRHNWRLPATGKQVRAAL